MDIYGNMRATFFFRGFKTYNMSHACAQKSPFPRSTSLNKERLARIQRPGCTGMGWIQEISNRTHVSRTPKKPEDPVARSQLTERGPLGFGPIQFLIRWMFCFRFSKVDSNGEYLPPMTSKYLPLKNPGSPNVRG